MSQLVDRGRDREERERDGEVPEEPERGHPTGRRGPRHHPENQTEEGNPLRESATNLRVVASQGALRPSSEPATEKNAAVDDDGPEERKQEQREKPPRLAQQHPERVTEQERAGEDEQQTDGDQEEAGNGPVLLALQ